MFSLFDRATPLHRHSASHLSCRAMSTGALLWHPHGAPAPWCRVVLPCQEASCFHHPAPRPALVHIGGLVWISYQPSDEVFPGKGPKAWPASCVIGLCRIDFEFCGQWQLLKAKASISGLMHAFLLFISKEIGSCGLVFVGVAALLSASFPQ